MQESETQYRNVVEDQTEFISRFLPNDTHVFVNEAYCRYFKKSREDIIGKKFMPNIPRKRINALLWTYFLSLTKENPIASLDHRIIMPDGEIRWQHWSDRAIFDEQGTLVEYQSVGRDITDAKQFRRGTAHLTILNFRQRTNRLLQPKRSCDKTMMN